MNVHPSIAKVSRVLVVVLAVVVVFVGARLFGVYRWQKDTQDLRARLDAAREPVRPKKVDFGKLEGQPAPVQRYFRAVLQYGQPMVTGVSVRHTGTFNTGEGAENDWKRFTSDQLVVTQRPGFDWNGRVAMMPGLPMRVHDAYVAGDGVLHASLPGIFTVADTRGTRDVERGGMLVQLDGEVAWLPPEGEKPYWRGRTTENLPRLRAVGEGLPR